MSIETIGLPFGCRAQTLIDFVFHRVRECLSLTAAEMGQTDIAYSNVPWVRSFWSERKRTAGESLRNPNPQKPKHKSMSSAACKECANQTAFDFPIAALSTFHVDVTGSVAHWENHLGSVRHGRDT